MIRVGQVYTNYGKKYVVTNFEKKVHLINKDGKGQARSIDAIHPMTLIATYPTWQEAVNSKEFNDEHK